jgi:hypothetical protein
MSRDALDDEMKAAGLMLTCKQASQLTSKSLDQPLSLAERMLLRLHLFICSGCRRFKLQLMQLRVAVKSMCLDTESDGAIQLSLAAKARISMAMQHTLSKDLNN